MGPLAGIRVLEFKSIGPGPFCGMLLADMGADVLIVDRPDERQSRPRRFDVMMRGKRSVMIDLKSTEGVSAALRLADRADVLLEGYRPGVMERLGLGPDIVSARNPRLVYGRLTGWGQDGPLAQSAGHDINFLALSGVLNAIGRADGPPTPPLNLLGDFAGGGLLMAFALTCGALEAQRSGRGQTIDLAMLDGCSLLATMVAGMKAAGQWSDERGANLLDGGSPWYDVYRTADGRYLAVGPVEPQFYAVFLERLGVAGDALPAQHDRNRWPELRNAFATRFATRTCEEWRAVFDGADACVTPVLSFDEAIAHPQNRDRQRHVEIGGIVQPAPAPLFSRTPAEVRCPPPERGQGGHAAMRDWGLSDEEIEVLRP